MKKQRGAVLVDLMAGLMISFLVGAVIMSAMQTSVSARETVNEQNQSQTDARQPLDLMADHLRNAQLSVNTLPEVAVTAGTATAVTYNTTGAPVTYALSGANLQRTESGTTTTVLTGITSLRFTYYKIASYNASGFVPCLTPTAPLSTEFPRLAAIQVDATVTQDGYTSSYSTIVRLRNSPKKLRL
jgi:Tfp pilus assembly protein PilW